MPIFRRKSSEKISDESARNVHDHADSGEGGLLRRLSSGSRHVRHHQMQPTQEGSAASPTGHPNAAAIASLSKAMGLTANTSTTAPHQSPPSTHSHATERSEKTKSSNSSQTRHDTGDQLSTTAAPNSGNLTMAEATHQPVDPDALSREDVRTLFHGAPHFMLEKGRRGRFFPQAFFPFSSPLEITDLEDRQYLVHESFALATLHSHLPIPHEIDHAHARRRPGTAASPSAATDTLTASAAASLGAAAAAAADDDDTSRLAQPDDSPSASQPATRDFTPTSTSSTTINPTTPLAGTARLATNRRPMFDLGIYERPNMLSLTGQERGTMGMRAFLERPVADGMGVDEKSGKSHKGTDVGTGTATGVVEIEHMSASEALRALAHEEGSVRVGKHAAWVDRVGLMREGPRSWRRVGVRGVSLRTITERLEVVSRLRDEVVAKGWRCTVLDVWGEEELGQWLFGELLYPPQEKEMGVFMGEEMGKGHALKVQIEALVKVLTTPGAWADLSLPRERLWFCQGLYTRELKEEGLVKSEMKRRFALVQLLLAVELVIRLDAALRLGVALHSREVEVSSVEIHHFNKLRNLKVDWDLVLARRWLDLCYVKKVPKKEFEEKEQLSTSPSSPPQSPREGSHGHHGGLLGRFKSSLRIQEKASDGAWPFECAVLPRQPGVMADGLIRFAEDIGWDAGAVDSVRAELARKLRDKTQAESEEMLALGTEALDHPHVAANHQDSRSKVELRAAGDETLGGPLTHTWLGGLIIPGYLACDLLMCALLETDTAQKPVEKLGNMAFPRTGFVLGGRSWWSKLCVVGMVLAGTKGAKERMGWIGLPDHLTPVDHETKQMLDDGWKLVVAEETPKLRSGERILDGDELAKESSPLGLGKGHVRATEFGMLTDQSFDQRDKILVSELRLVLKRHSMDSDQGCQAAVSAQVVREGASEAHRRTVLLPLQYNVRFVSGHPCRPPQGYAMQHGSDGRGRQGEEEQQQHLKHKHPEHLPAHPLHKSFKYSDRSLSEILDLGPGDELTLPNPTDKEASTVWVVDARGGREKETLARAWCASVGRHAIISRVAKTCLSCMVREARALEIGVVLRVEAS